MQKLVHYFFEQRKLNSVCPYSLSISIYPMQLFAYFPVRVRLWRKEFPGFLSLEKEAEGGGRGCHYHLGTLITPAVLYGYTRSWVPIHQVIGSSFMPDRRSKNFVKSTVFFYLARLLLLCKFLYSINFTTLSFSVFLMVSLKKYCYFYLSLIPTSSLESNLFYHILTEKTFPRCFSRRWTNKRLE